MRVLLLALVLFFSAGCLTTPPELVVTENGQVIELTVEQKLERIEAQYEQAKATIASLQASAGFLPPGMDVAALGILSALSAGLERKRRQLKAEIKAKEGASV